MYNWETIEVDPRAGAVAGRIEFRDAVWLSGAANFNVPFTFLELPVAAAEFPVLAFNFSYSSNPSATAIATFGPCSLYASGINCAAAGLSLTDTVVLTPNRWSGNFVFGDILNLNMKSAYASGGVLEFLSISPTVTALSIDGPGGGQNCGGDRLGNICFGTGRWVLDRSSIPVPEPGTLALLAGLSLAGLGVVRKSRPSQVGDCADARAA